MERGDKIKIVDYGRPDDIDLIDWANEQKTNIFTIEEIDNQSQIFFIKGCNYGIPFESIDYAIIK